MDKDELARASVDDLVFVMLQELHANVPEIERPMSLSDLSDDQMSRARNAVKAILSALRETDSASEAITMAPIDELARLREDWGGLHVDPDRPGILIADNDPLTGILVGRFSRVIAEIINAALRGENSGALNVAHQPLENDNGR